MVQWFPGFFKEPLRDCYTLRNGASAVFAAPEPGVELPEMSVTTKPKRAAKKRMAAPREGLSKRKCLTAAVPAEHGGAPAAQGSEDGEWA